MIYFVTGTPRTGSSMMMHILVQGGIPYPHKEESKEAQKRMRNIHGFYENIVQPLPKTDVAVKCFAGLFIKKTAEEQPVKIICMQRDINKIGRSWGSVKGANYPITNIPELRERLKTHLVGLDVLTLDYDFVCQNPNLAIERIASFLKCDYFDKQKALSAIDTKLYINRGI